VLIISSPYQCLDSVISTAGKESSVDDFKHDVGHSLVQAAHDYFHHAPVFLVEPNDRAYQHHLFVEESTAQQQVVGLFGHVDLVRTLADTHAEALRDAVDRVLHRLEGQRERRKHLSALRVRAEHLPELNELALRHQVGFDVIADGDGDLGDVIFFFV